MRGSCSDSLILAVYSASIFCGAAFDWASSPVAPAAATTAMTTAV
jgi:hypothetical protein